MPLTKKEALYSIWSKPRGPQLCPRDSAFQTRAEHSPHVKYGKEGAAIFCFNIEHE